MAAERQVPGPAADNNERITSRPYDGFATLPEEEVQPLSAPGAGPHGTVGGRVKAPSLLVAAGLAVCFATFVVGQPLLLAVGLAMIFAGGVWSARRYGRAGKGLGPTTVRSGQRRDHGPADRP